MKPNRMLEYLRAQEEVVAAFGQAQLVRSLDGKLELRGGTPEERQQAQEWVSKFWSKGESKVQG